MIKKASIFCSNQSTTVDHSKMSSEEAMLTSESNYLNTLKHAIKNATIIRTKKVFDSELQVNTNSQIADCLVCILASTLVVSDQYNVCKLKNLRALVCATIEYNSASLCEFSLSLSRPTLRSLSCSQYIEVLKWPGAIHYPVLASCQRLVSAHFEQVTHCENSQLQIPHTVIYFLLCKCANVNIICGESIQYMELFECPLSIDVGRCKSGFRLFLTNVNHMPLIVGGSVELISSGSQIVFQVKK